ncbi:MAG: (d)CMP kinase, partial [Burkholderiales bacterium]
TRQEITIEVVGELISRPYVEITLNLMARFGVSVVRSGINVFTIPAGSRFRSPGTLFVEGDASGASYFLAAGAIACGPVRVEGVDRHSIQGDLRFADTLADLGARIAWGEGWLEARAPASGRLRAFDLDLNHIPDAAMTLAVVALFTDGPCRLRNIASWRVKETDRIAAMATELRKLGAVVEVGADQLKILPPRQLLAGATIDTYDDHRMAMCFSLVALGNVSVNIRDPKCVAKTFPEYFERFSQIASDTGVPVVAIDGPSASGKGVVARKVADALGFHYLDSGALYRLVALSALEKGVRLDDTVRLGQLSENLQAGFQDDRIELEGRDVTDRIRAENVSDAASKIAGLASVRQGLLRFQRSNCRKPGLVAEGRDMGSVVFPDAFLKVFLTASVEERARRRYKQLKEKGFDANLTDLLQDIALRDRRDSERSLAPLQKSADAQLLETTGLSIEESVSQVVQWFESVRRQAPSR